MEEILHVLKIMYQATVVMQKEDFRLSDFYATWNFVDIKLNKLARKGNSTGLVSKMIIKLAQRKPQLLDSPTMSAALALDPRFCKELNNEQIGIAVKTLENLRAQSMNQNKCDQRTISEH